MVEGYGRVVLTPGPRNDSDWHPVSQSEDRFALKAAMALLARAALEAAAESLGAALSALNNCGNSIASVHLNHAIAALRGDAVRTRDGGRTLNETRVSFLPSIRYD